MTSMAQMNGIDPDFSGNVNYKTRPNDRKKTYIIARSDVFVAIGEDSE